MSRKPTGTEDHFTSAGRILMAQIMAIKTKPHVKIGVLQEDFGKEKETPTGVEKDATLGEVAVYNEFGTLPPNGGVGKHGPVHGTPERSFIRSTADENRKYDWPAYADELRKEVVAGRMTTDRMLGLMGQRIKKDIQMKIRSNVPPPNAPSTIAAKGGKDKTLINTGQLLNSINYEVVRTGERPHE